MRHTFPSASRRCWLVIASFLMLGLGGGLRAQVTELGQGAEMKFEVQLIWATNDKKSPNPKHKDVDPETRKKLGELPLKWEHYFEVNRKKFDIIKGGNKRVSISETCAIELKHLDQDKVEVSLYGKKGEVVGKQTQPLPKGNILVLGGNAPAETGWLVTLKRIE